MTDRAYDPATPNPFDQFDPDKVGALPANQNNKKPDDPFEEFNPFPGQGIKAQPDQSSTTGAFARGAERSIIPALGSIPAIGAGAEVGAAVGAAGGPLAPITVPVGALIGGVVGGFGGSYLLSQAQNYVLSKAPDSWKEKIGLDDRQEKLDEQEHPYASFLGGLTPYALTMRPGLATTTKLPENATALQRILAHPATARVFGGAAMGGMELGQEAASGQTPDWTKVAVSTGFGLVFNTPTRIGESLTEIGARPARTLLGRPQPVPAATAPPTAEQPTEAPQEAQSIAEPRPAPPQGVAATLFHAPTVAQASDLNVMGPGVTKEVFEGVHERNPSAAMTAQDAARTETLVTQTTPLLPDIHQVARRMDPDLFDQYEEINQRRNTLQEWVTSEGAENAPVAAGHLATLNGELAELEPKIAAAYRRAAEASGHPTVEPQPVSESWGLFPPPEVRPSAPIDATHTVRSGANSTTDGTVVVDNHIPQFSPKLKDGQGNPANLHKFLAEHETVEAQLMKEGMPYEQAHIRATAAERAKVEAAGVDWNAYTHEIDGYLDHVEHEPNSNPPTQPVHVDPESAIGHHRAANKVEPEKTGLAAIPDEVFGPISNTEIETQRNPDTGAARLTLSPDEIKVLQNAGIEINEYGGIDEVNLNKLSQERTRRQAEQTARFKAREAARLAATGPIGTAPRSIEAQKAFIAADVAKQLTAAGRPSEEAEAAGKLVAARYEARAARMSGRLGTAQELYEREGALIRGPRGPAAPPPATPPTVAPTPAAEAPIVQFRRDAADIEQQLEPVPAGMTRLWRADRPGQKGTAFTNDLPGLALPFRKAYGGDLSYVDVASADLPKYENVAGTAHNAEFNLPKEIAAKAKTTTPPTVTPLAERAPADQWNAFVAARQERETRLRIPTGFNDFHTRSGGTFLRADATQQWVPGNVVDVGFVKDLLITAKNSDGTFTLIAKPNKSGISKSYNVKPQEGLVGDKPVSFKEATAALLEATKPTEEIPESEITTTHVGPKTARGPRAVPQGYREKTWTEFYQRRETGVTTELPDGLSIASGPSSELRTDAAPHAHEIRIVDEDGKTQYRGEITQERDGLWGVGYVENLSRQYSGLAPALYQAMAKYAEERGGTLIAGMNVNRLSRAVLDRLKDGGLVEPIKVGDRDLLKIKSQVATTEPGAEGKPQLVLPGAERISDAERAQRAANQPLRPTAEQKPMDEGLFGDQKNQGELFQLARVMHNTEVDERDNGNVFIRSKDDPDDSLSLWVGRHAVYSRLASVLKSNRGQGIGTALYERAIKYADEKGLPLRSDINVTNDGMHVYDALKRRGYEVTEAPDSRKSALGITNGMAGYVYEVRLPTEKRELFQQARGGIVLNPNAVPGHDYIGMENVKPLLRITSEGNASTFIHESGHQYLAELVRDASHEAAPQELKDDLRTVTDWLGLKGPEDLKLYPESNRISKISATKAHEKFARGFEQYLREGVAPSQELAGVFAKFKNWLLGIYRTIKGLGSPINDDVKRVFDRLLTTEPQKTVIAPERNQRPSLADIHRIDAQETPPNEAEPRGDLVNNEADRYIAEPHAEIAHEIQARTAEVQAEQAATAGTAAEPAGEARPDQNGPTVLGTSGGGTEPVAPGGGVGEGRSAVEESGGGPVREGNELSGSERGPEPANATRDQPLAPNPAASLGARESPFLDKAGNIRLENLTNDHDVREAIRDAASENDDFIGDRRGVVTDGQVQDLANELGMEGAEALVKKHVVGQAYNAEQVWAVRKLLIQSATEVSAAMKKAAIGTDEDLMAYAIAKDRHQLIQATVAGITAEAGRALRAFRTMAGEEGAQATNEFIKQATGKTLFQLKMEAKLGAQLDSPAKISKFLNDARDRSFGGMVLEYWINGLISGIATHVTYVQGNIILALEKAGPETAIAAALGAARRAGGRPGEVVHIGEVGAQLKGAIRGLPGAAEAFLEAMRSGQTTLLPGEQARPLMPFSGDTSLAVAKSMTDNPVAWREVGAQAFSMIRGIRDGFVAGAALLKAGGIEGAPLIGASYSTLGQIPDLAVRGVTVLPVGSTIRVPGRSVAAIHSFFRSLNYSMNKSAEAFRMASEEGLTGNAFDSRVGDIWQNPTPEIMERSRETATQLTLMGQGGEFVKALSKLTNATLDLPVIGKIAPLKFIDPFVHIGANIIKQAIVERTPVGILSPEIRADLMGKNGNIAQDMASARMIAGTSIALLFGGLAMEGYASGSGPSDPRQSAMWRLAGNQAHSVRIGDIWYQVNRLGPMGMLMSTAADFYDVAHEAAQGDVLMAASHIQHAITQNILDESFMRGPADLIKAVEDPGRYGEAYIKNFLSSFVPFSVGMAQMARASDPYSRQARTVMDSIKAKVPGLSETLLPRRDIWGEEMPSYEALGHAGVTAIYETRVNRDPVNQAMLQLGIYPAQPIRKIRNVDLTDQQYDDYSRIAGRMTKMRLDAIVNSPDWQTWPNHIKHDVISEVIRQSREAASGVMMAKYPQIPADATAFKMKKLQD